MNDIANQNSKPWYLKLHWQVLLALVVGIAFGWLAPSAAEGIGFIGDLFLRLLKMIIIPLIFTSLVSGVASLGSARSVGRVGFRTVLYYTVSTSSSRVSISTSPARASCRRVFQRPHRPFPNSC